MPEGSVVLHEHHPIERARLHRHYRRYAALYLVLYIGLSWYTISQLNELEAHPDGYVEVHELVALIYYLGGYWPAALLFPFFMALFVRMLLRKPDAQVAGDRHTPGAEDFIVSR